VKALPQSPNEVFMVRIRGNRSMLGRQLRHVDQQMVMAGLWIVDACGCHADALQSEFTVMGLDSTSPLAGAMK
jgi:hypothetical protein